MRKRAIIETIRDPLKNIQQVEHTRHRNLSHRQGYIALVRWCSPMVGRLHEADIPAARAELMSEGVGVKEGDQSVRLS